MMSNKKPTTQQSKDALRMLYRSRRDFQDMRIRLDNRCCRKKDGEKMKVENMAARDIHELDLARMTNIADVCRGQEIEIEQAMKALLPRFPVYNEFLKGVKGCGTVVSAAIISSFDIYKATTVSKMWQYAGLNPGMVHGTKARKNKDGATELYKVKTLVKGDRPTSGFILPYNADLRKDLCGIFSASSIRCQSDYAMQHYYPYKERLQHSEGTVKEWSGSKGNRKLIDVQWKNATPGHIDKAARRNMVKHFLIDLYKAWRELEGLHVRGTYQEEKLKHTHQDVQLEEELVA
jgi:ribosomal protein S13